MKIELPNFEQHIEDSKPILFDDEHFMRAALRCAQNAAAAGAHRMPPLPVKFPLALWR